MKTTLDLPDDLVKELKLLAVHEDKRLKDAVADVLRAGLAARSTLRARPKRGRILIKKDQKTGLPVIQCPADAPARRMTTEQLLKLERESQTREDLERLGVPIRQ